MNYLYTIFILIISCYSPNESVLKRVDSFPKVQHNLFFKTIPFMAIDEYRSLYLIDNVEHAVYKLDVLKDEVIKIAGKGQGPGEVQFPTRTYISGNILFVSDNTAINMFELNGKYVNRFKKYETDISFCADGQTIYVAQTGGKYLIQEYTYEGKRKNSFGYKYEYNRDLFKGWPETFIDSEINQGKILLSNSHIYFISTELSELFKYNKEGVLIKKEVIEEDELTKESREAYFKKGQNRPANAMFRTQELVIDAYYYNGKLYILRRYLNDGKRDIELLVIAEDDWKTVKKYFFESEEYMSEDWLRSLCVGGPNRLFPNIYISKYDKKLEDYIIKVFKEDK